MNLSRKWLNEFVDLPLSEFPDRAFAEAMTVSGSKVETTEDLSLSCRNVKVGRITALEKHPDSDHMLVCTLDVGAPQTAQIVTGAWNVHVGDLVPVALDGALLPNGTEIHAGRLRGVQSEGMLCSLKELGLTAHDYPDSEVFAAALLRDYRPLDPAKPSISPDIAPGDKIYGPVLCAEVTALAPAPSGWTVTLALNPVIARSIATREKRATSPALLATWQSPEQHESPTGGTSSVSVLTPFSNLHAGDLVAFNTKTQTICSLSDLRAEQKEFPHCIPDGIFIIHEPCAPGDDVAALIGRDDHVVEFEITPNRPDCLCMIGLAREAAVTFDRPLKIHTPDVEAKAGGDIRDLTKIFIDEPTLCRRYTARMVRNVKIAPSPAWMRERIRNAGMRPINNLVDITNYVMLEYGQPMHAFDFSCVSGGEIHVRCARPGESIRTLDGTERALSESMLCICDTEKPVGVAGVMGGENSEIVGDTAMVLFESANFDGVSIRRTATALGMRTDASSRYEKGLDPENTYRAVQRACELVELLGAGEVVEGVIDVYPAGKKETELLLEPGKINALLGTDIGPDTMCEILRKLGFETEGQLVKVPSWRADVEHWSDLAEEVARFYGYNEIPTRFTGTISKSGGLTPAQLCEVQIGAACRSLGLDEIITYSFISPSYYDKIRLPADSPLRDSLRILNPLGEDTSIMRTTTLPSMLEILTRNYNYRNKEARLYEIGRTYLPRPDGLADEPKTVSLGAYGDGMDFFTLKGWVEALLNELKIPGVRFTACTDDPSYHPGRCAKILAFPSTCHCETSAQTPSDTCHCEHSDAREACDDPSSAVTDVTGVAISSPFSQLSVSYHPGRCAKILAFPSTCHCEPVTDVTGVAISSPDPAQPIVIGILGQIHPLVMRNYGVDAAFWCAQLSFDALLRLRGGTPVFKPLPRFPAVTRDIAVVCDVSLPAGDLQDCIRLAGGETLVDCRVFDVYTGVGIAPGKKSVAFSLTMRSDDQTLTDDHAEALVQRVLTALKEKFNAQMR